MPVLPRIHSTVEITGCWFHFSAEEVEEEEEEEEEDGSMSVEC